MRTLTAVLVLACLAPAAGALARPSPARALRQNPPYRVGERVQVRWAGAWHAATVLEVGTGRDAGTVKVRYDGYGANWDEYVSPDRIARSSAPAPAPQPPAAALVPEGRYVCQAFEAGQLHTQGAFVLRPGGTYEDPANRSRGRWTHDPASGALRFTGGSLQNGAAARLVRTAQGKTAVAFTWRGGETRWCYRQRG